MSNKDVLARIKGTSNMQFGKDVIITQMEFATLEAIFEVDHKVQRELDTRKRSAIKEFILNIVEKGDFYFSPFVFSAREELKAVEDGWELEPGCKLIILDGQHRAAAMSSAVNFLKLKKETYEDFSSNEDVERLQGYIEKLQSYPITLQIYLGLSREEERQLFTDLNTQRREAHIGQVVLYDHRDEYALIAKELAKQLEGAFEIEMKLSRLTKQNTAVTSLTIMRRCLLALFEGALSPTNGNIQCNSKFVLKVAKTFFEKWVELFPKQMGNRDKYVTGLTGIQVALAYTVFLLSQHEDITHVEAIERLKLLKHFCSWKHNDPLFKDFYDPTSKRIKNHSTPSAIYVTLVNLWFDRLVQFHPAKTIGHSDKTMLADFPILVSIALYVNQHMKEEQFEKRKKVLVEKMKSLQSISWERTNPFWEQTFKGRRKGKGNYFYISNDKRTLDGLVRWFETGAGTRLR